MYKNIMERQRWKQTTDPSLDKQDKAQASEREEEKKKKRKEKGGSKEEAKRETGRKREGEREEAREGGRNNYSSRGRIYKTLNTHIKTQGLLLIYVPVHSATNAIERSWRISKMNEKQLQ